MTPISWDDFRLVRALADSGTMAGAADALGINHSTVFRRLNALEEQIGVRVFERSRSRYALTTAGAEMTALAERMADEIVAFERRIAGRGIEPSGEVRVTASDTIFEFVLAPIMRDFRAQFPAIRLDIIVENRALNLSRRDADVALRAGRDPHDTLVGRKLAHVNWGVYSRAGDQNEASPWIGFGEPLHEIEVSAWLANVASPAEIGVRVNSVGGMLAAIRAGLGRGLLPVFIGDVAGGLDYLGPIPIQEPSALWLLTHPDLRNAARIRAFLNFAGAAIARRRRSFEGDPSAGGVDMTTPPKQTPAA